MNLFKDSKATYRLLDEAGEGLEYVQEQALMVMDKLERFRVDIANEETSPTWSKIFADVRREIEANSIIKDAVIFGGSSPNSGKPDPVGKELAIMKVQNLLYLHYNSRMEKKGNKVNSCLLEMQGMHHKLAAINVAEADVNPEELQLRLKVSLAKIKKIERVQRIARGELSVFLLMAKAQQEPVPPATIGQ